MKKKLISATHKAPPRRGFRFWLALPFLVGFGLVWTWLRSIDLETEEEHGIQPEDLEPEPHMAERSSDPAPQPATGQKDQSDDAATRSEGQLFMDRSEELLPPTQAESITWSGELADPPVESVSDVAGELAVDALSGRPTAVAATSEDDLQILEGIGPKIAEMLQAEGIRTFKDLADADPEQLRSLLKAQGLSLIDPETWPEQARLAAAGDQTGLKDFQSQLRGGRRI